MLVNRHPHREGDGTRRREVRVFWLAAIMLVLAAIFGVFSTASRMVHPGSGIMLLVWLLLLFGAVMSGVGALIAGGLVVWLQVWPEFFRDRSADADGV